MVDITPYITPLDQKKVSFLGKVSNFFARITSGAKNLFKKLFSGILNKKIESRIAEDEEKSIPKLINQRVSELQPNSALAEKFKNYKTAIENEERIRENPRQRHGDEQTDLEVNTRDLKNASTGKASARLELMLEIGKQSSYGERIESIYEQINDTGSEDAKKAKGEFEQLVCKITTDLEKQILELEEPLQKTY
ncbi:MAG: hypothetical protein LBI56_00440 [Puniceicoccales bacterium]|jgi:hypothetical protein|nr:hypothetical protein [Puniceicoccales bacterium]